MDALVKAGKTRYWGISKHEPTQLREFYTTALEAGTSPPAGIEDYYTVAGASLREDRQSRPRWMEREMFPVVRDLGVGVIAFSPMDTGCLAPGREPQTGSPVDTICQSLDTVADELAVSRAEVCVAWVLARTEVTSVLAGSESPGHVDQMVAATSLVLPAELMATLDTASERFSQEMVTWDSES